MHFSLTRRAIDGILADFWSRGREPVPLVLSHTYEDQPWKARLLETVTLGNPHVARRTLPWRRRLHFDAFEEICCQMRRCRWLNWITGSFGRHLTVVLGYPGGETEGAAIAGNHGLWYSTVGDCGQYNATGQDIAKLLDEPGPITLTLLFAPPKKLAGACYATSTRVSGNEVGILLDDIRNCHLIGQVLPLADGFDLEIAVSLACALERTWNGSIPAPTRVAPRVLDRPVYPAELVF